MPRPPHIHASGARDSEGVGGRAKETTTTTVMACDCSVLIAGLAGALSHSVARTGLRRSEIFGAAVVVVSQTAPIRSTKDRDWLSPSTTG